MRYRSGAGDPFLAARLYDLVIRDSNIFNRNDGRAESERLSIMRLGRDRKTNTHILALRDTALGAMRATTPLDTINTLMEIRILPPASMKVAYIKSVGIVKARLPRHFLWSRWINELLPIEEKKKINKSSLEEMNCVFHDTEENGSISSRIAARREHIIRKRKDIMYAWPCERNRWTQGNNI